MSVGAGSIKRATASAKPAEAPVEAKESVVAAAALKKSAPKTTAAPKTAVITGANPDIEFYHISEDLPIHLL